MQDKKNESSPPKEKLALVLTGGGARGAYQIGVLKYLAEVHPNADFKILLGSSAGAINASALASQKGSFRESVNELERFWTTLKIAQVIKIDVWSLLKRSGFWLFNLIFGGITGKPMVSSLIDSSPLRQLIFDVYNPDIVKDAIDSGKLDTLAIQATEIATASSVTFVQSLNHKPWRRAKRRSELTSITHKHILASSAIPFLFKNVRIGKRYYLDGSVKSHTPLSPAARLGATKIFSIGVRKLADPNQFLSHDMQEEDPKPNFGQIAGLVLNSMFSDALDSDADHLERMNDLINVNPQAALNTVNMRPIDVCVIRPSEDIGQIASQYVSRLPIVLRYLLRGIGSEQKKSSDVVSYLLFDGLYAKHLMKMGYEDAKKQHDQLAKFFGFSTSKQDSKSAA